MNKIQTAMTAASNYFSYGYDVSIALTHLPDSQDGASVSIHGKDELHGMRLIRSFHSTFPDQMKDIIAMSTHTKEQAEAFLNEKA